MLDRVSDGERALLGRARDVHRPRRVAEVAAQLAEDRRDRKGLKRAAASRVETVDRLQQGDICDLYQILVGHRRVRVASRELSRERHEAQRQRLTRAGIAPVAAGEKQLGLCRPQAGPRVRTGTHGLCRRHDQLPSSSAALLQRRYRPSFTRNRPICLLCSRQMVEATLGGKGARERVLESVYEPFSMRGMRAVGVDEVAPRWGSPRRGRPRRRQARQVDGAPVIDDYS